MPKLPQTCAEPFWSTTDGRHVRLYHGNVTDVLARLPEKSVHCCVTSPPYWGLRDYGTGTWEGGDAKCDHVERTKKDAHKTSTLGPTAAERARGDLRREHPAENAAFKATARQFAERCKKCGAKRIDQQIGSEPSPDEFVAKMVDVFRGVWRVLRDDGTVWLNLGSSYFSGKVVDGNTPYSLRDDLTTDEIRYVLHELSRMNNGGEISKPD